MAAMLEFRTQGFNPYAVKYSPYHDSRLAVGAASNFGIVGNGRLFALAMTAQGIQVEKTYVVSLSLSHIGFLSFFCPPLHRNTAHRQ